MIENSCSSGGLLKVAGGCYSKHPAHGTPRFRMTPPGGRRAHPELVLTMVRRIFYAACEDFDTGASAWLICEGSVEALNLTWR